MSIIGMETRGLSSPQGRHTFIAVLVAGENNDVACYVGLGNPAFVAEYGDLVTLAEAEIHFPALRSEMEARGWTYRG